MNAKSQNFHSLIILHPNINDTYKRLSKIYVVAHKDGGVKTCTCAMWDGEHFIGFNGLRINRVEWWGNFPAHPENLAKRW